MKPETIVAIIDARRAGKSRKEVASSFGVSEYTLKRYDAHLRCDEPEDNLLRVRMYLLHRPRSFARDELDALSRA